MDKFDVLQDFENASRATLILTQKWNIEIILTLHSEGVLRFNELKKLCISQFRGNINSRILAERLKFFCLRGLLERISYNEFPPRVEYRLTDDGEQFARALCRTLYEFMTIMPKEYPESMNEATQHSYMEPRKKLVSKKIEKNVRLYNHVGNVVKCINQ